MTKIIFPFLSGLLLFLSFPPFNLYPLAFVGLVPFLFSLERCKKGRGAFFCGFLFGITYFTLLLYWVRIYHFLALPFVVAVLSLYPAIFALIYSKFRKPSLIFAPILWTSLEYLSSLGPLGFPWGALAYSQTKNLALIQMAEFTGIFGVSFLVVLLNSALLRLIERQEKNLATENTETTEKEFLSSLSSYLSVNSVAYFSVFLLLACYLYGFWTLSKPLPPKDLKVAVVQGNFDTDLNWGEIKEEIYRDLARLTREAEDTSPSLTVWTETVVSDYLAIRQDLVEEFSKLTRGSLLAGAHHFKGERYYNSAFLISEGKILGRYDKIHLVPFGEFIPLESLFPSLRRLLPECGNFSAGDEFTLLNLEKHKFAILICFEDFFGSLSRKFVKKGADFLVNITNDDWSKSKTSHLQHLSGSIFRAIENRVYLVRAGNTGVSAIIDPYGRIEKRLKIYTQGTLAGKISKGTKKTFYTKYGDLFSLICLCLTLIIPLIAGLNKRKG
ncbi:apolipoprotein N-acyltransferase [bacterium]|nr:apolipoprotein N-acyltransferase [bacterium]